MFYLVKTFRTSSLRGNISSNPERTIPRRWGGGVGARLHRSLQEGAGRQDIKRLLLFKKNQISQVEEFSGFLCMRRCKRLGSLKLFLSHASQLSGASQHPVI